MDISAHTADAKHRHTGILQALDALLSEEQLGS
jgi:hypothetical protein